MKVHTDSEITLTVTLNEEEINYINATTQNYQGEEFTDETKDEARIRMVLFVATSRALGFNMNDDGEIQG